VTRPRDPEVEALWEAEAARYDAVYDLTGRRGSVARARLAAAVELIGPGPGRVLDLGMGGGRLCVALDKRGWDVFGVDSSEAMVALAQSRMPTAYDRLAKAPAESLPFPDAAFDAVTALGVLEYTNALPAALGELARVLRPGGRAVVSFPHYRGLVALWRRHVVYATARAVKQLVPFGRTRPPRATNPLSRGSLIALLSSAGLELESLVYLGPRGRRRGPSGRVLGAQLLLVCRRQPA
jgi:ubiquinone/menaquinone biosynthesis C-methylase UbiE